jgi:hypothetical protein
MILRVTRCTPSDLSPVAFERAWALVPRPRSLTGAPLASDPAAAPKLRERSVIGARNRIVSRVTAVVVAVIH